MKEIFYRITLLEPGLFTSLEGDPNSGASFPFIPGGVLRGALIHKYREKNTIDPAADAARQFFFNGKTRFLNGYPVLKKTRSRPTPLSWQHEKRVQDLAKDAAAQTLEPDKQWGGVKKPFAVKAGDATVIDPERQLTIHIQRPRVPGRPKRNDGAIYRYEALAPNQVFIAAIQCDVDADAEELKKLVSDEISLGGARTGAYGRAQIELVKADELAQAETPSAAESQTTTDKLFVILESDALLRDECGQYTSDPKVVGQAIAKRLGVKDANALGALNAWMRTRFVGGFNRTWGLPLPQMMAIEMGSVFEFNLPSGNLNLSELETQGIGERRAEGFGRVAVYSPVKQTLSLKKWEYAVSGQAVDLDPESAKVAKQLVERLVRRRLDENVVAVAYALDMDADSLRRIQAAQLSRLRNIIHDELAGQRSIERIQNYLKKVMARSTPQKQFTRARVDKTRLADWLTSILDFKTANARRDNVLNVQGLPTLGMHKPEDARDALRNEYVLRFLDAALLRALKLKRDKEG